MSTGPETRAKLSVGSWLHRHLPILLYGWFWFGMFLCGLLAPPDRVAALESEWLTEGWQLSAMSAVFGVAIVTAYFVRIRPKPGRTP